MWVCTGCNRLKGNRFAVDNRNRPLLIDPTIENPCDFLYFDALTGNITAKYDSSTGKPSRKGIHTVDPTVLPLNIEPVTEGRQRTRRNLVRAVNHFLHRTKSSPLPVLQGEVIEAIQDNDDYGLAHWYFQRDGESEEPFRTLRIAHPSVWQNIGQSL